MYDGSTIHGKRNGKWGWGPYEALHIPPLAWMIVWVVDEWEQDDGCDWKILVDKEGDHDSQTMSMITIVVAVIVIVGEVVVVAAYTQYFPTEDVYVSTVVSLPTLLHVKKN